MANANRPSGFTPVQYLNGSTWSGQARLYSIAAAYATALYIGDPVISSGTADVNGVPGVVLGAATGALTGDKDQSLLMRAGLGALGGFGGSGIASSLGSMGAKAGAQAGLASAGEAAASAGGAGTAAGEAAAMEAIRSAPTSSAFSNVLSGAQQLGTTAGREAFMAGMPFGKYGLAAAGAPVAAEAFKQPTLEPVATHRIAAAF